MVGRLVRCRYDGNHLLGLEKIGVSREGREQGEKEWKTAGKIFCTEFCQYGLNG